MNTKTKTNTLRLATMGMLAALAVLLVALIHFPLLPAASFLEYDPADIPVLIGTFLYGPWAGLALTAVVSIVQACTVSAASGWIGCVMHLAATGVFSVVAGLIYRKHCTRKGAVVALCAGSVCMAIVMAGCNLVLTPLFMGQGIQTVIDMLVPVIIPFNLLKSGINSVVTFLLYKPLSSFLHGIGAKA